MHFPRFQRCTFIVFDLNVVSLPLLTPTERQKLLKVYWLSSYTSIVVHESKKKFHYLSMHNDVDHRMKHWIYFSLSFAIPTFSLLRSLFKWFIDFVASCRFICSLLWVEYIVHLDVVFHVAWDAKQIEMFSVLTRYTSPTCGISLKSETWKARIRGEENKLEQSQHIAEYSRVNISWLMWQGEVKRLLVLEGMRRDWECRVWSVLMFFFHCECTRASE